MGTETVCRNNRTEGGKTMILFSAIFPDEAVKDVCTALQDQLKEQTEGSYPVRENLHVTTFYFGETTDETAARIQAILAAHPIPEMKIMLDHIHRFGGPSGGHIVYAGTNNEALHAWRKETADVFAAEGIAYSPEVFLPHITLVRAKQHPVRFLPDHVPVMTSSASVHVLLESLQIAGKRVYRPFAGD